MLTIVPGSNDTFLREGKLVNSLGVEITEENPTLELYGKSYTRPVSWFKNLAVFGLEFTPEVQHGLEVLEFVQTKKFSSKVKSDLLPVFTQPVLVRGQYRVLARYPRYAISADAKVIDLVRDINLTSDRLSYGYWCVSITDSLVQTSRDITLHRLLGLAWIPNDDYVTKSILNHKDGNKLNCRLDNLEWVSFKRNVDHAVENSLNKCSFGCRVRSYLTKEVKEFPSLSRAAEFMGMGPRVALSAFTKIRQHVLINGEFEVRLGSDQTPWFYEGLDTPVCPGRYTLVVNEGDSERTFHDVRSAGNYYQIKNFIGKNVQRVAKMIEAKVNATVSITDHYSQPKPKPLKAVVMNYQLRADNKNLKETLTFNSLREASRYFGIDKKLIKARVLNGKELKGWKFYQYTTTQ